MAKKVENQTRISDIPEQVKNILAAQKKKKVPKIKPVVKGILIWCTACTKNYTVFKKDNKGEMIEQQICPHTILKKVLLK